MTNQNNEKSKNGKRLALILIALLLIVAVAFGAYTYSRYVSRQNGTGSATVAQWGFTVTMTDTNGDEATNSNGFATRYSISENVVNGVPEATTSNIVAAAVSTEGNIVMPGASGSVTFTVGGSAEVTAELRATFDSISHISLSLSRDGAATTPVTYYPIQFSFDNGDYSNDVAALENSLSSTLLDTYDVIGEEASGTHTLSWQWLFDAETVTISDATFYADDLDTILGQIAAATDPIDLSDYKVTDTSNNEWTVSAYELEEEFTLSAFIQQTLNGGTVTGD